MKTIKRLRRRPIILGVHWAMVLVATFAISLLVAYGIFGRRQAQVRARCNQLFHQVRASRQERIKYPHIETDEQAAFEREQWTDIIDQSSQRIPTATRSSKQSSLNVLSGQSLDDDNHWAYRRLRSIEPPNVSNPNWVKNPIDQFVLVSLEEQGLAPAEEASAQHLAHRLWFDLIGLPPSPREMTAYLTDNHPQKFEARVEELLDRSAFGERWARTWLDVARYADSNGYEEDEIRRHAYPYRDYVIWAMNHDLPFDEFVRWQIAGDEIAGDNPLAVAATGFLTAGPYNTFLPQPSERRDELDDIVSTIGTAMLGTTIGCARCHDHMYDPIPTEEYYGLVAIFADTQRQHRYLVPNGGQEYLPIDANLAELREIRRARVTEEKIASLEDFTEEEKELLRQPIDPNNERQALLLSRCGRCRLVMDHEISGEIDPLPEDEGRFQYLNEENERLASRLPPPPPKGLILSGSHVCTTDVLPGGQPSRKTKQVGPSFLQALTPEVTSWEDSTWELWVKENQEPKPRTALANWLVDLEAGAGPLLARVIVNRLWQHHFGEGLVRTPNDFGYQGDTPQHAELLEWLATELVLHDWSLKHIHYLMVTSATYRQSASPRAGYAQDAGSHHSRRHNSLSNQGIFQPRARRLTAEMIRDAMLFVSGSLNTTLYGPAVFVPIPSNAIYNKEQQENLMWPEHVPERDAIRRRSIYVLMKRTNPVPLLQLFDGPDGSMSCGKRSETTVPTQALAMLNSEFIRLQSARLADRLSGETRTKPELVDAVFQLALTRQPTQEERDLGVEFLSSIDDDSLDSALVDLCQVMLMSNEFSYTD